jgi:hypothetical protein
MLKRQDVVKIVADALSKGWTVFAPVSRAWGAMLEQIDDPGAVTFDHVLTVNTLKDVLLPRCESLARFDLDRQEISAVGDVGGRILVLGSRPCDAAAAAIVDSILIGDVTDKAYAERRERTVIITLGCAAADDACFCTSMGYGPHDPTGSDVLLLPKAGDFIVRPLSDKGREVLDELGVSEDASVESDAPPDLERRVETGQLKQWLDANFDSPKWRSVSENCVSCGTCYYLCPTCHCFDITDEAGASRGERLRIWDCCSFPGFTKMASHQPRMGRHARYRQRVLHKFKYTVDNVGKVACVGDGRCIRYCTFGVDICEILDELVKEA